MKKRGFISVYVLLLLILIAITVSFIYKQNLNSRELEKDLYLRKKNIYETESLLNVLFYEDDDLIKEALEKYYIKSLYNTSQDRKYFDNEGYKAFNRNSGKINFNFNDKRYSLPIGYDEIFHLFRIYVKNNNKNSSTNGILEFSMKGNNLIPYDKNKVNFIKDKDSLDLIENIKFSNYKLKSFEKVDIDSLDESENFIHIKGDFVVDNKEKEDSNSEDGKINDNKNVEKRLLNGILVVDGNIILKKDLEYNGLIVLRGGKITFESKSKLYLKGNIISTNNINTDMIEFKYDKRVIDYITDIVGFYDLKKEKLFID